MAVAIERSRTSTHPWDSSLYGRIVDVRVRADELIVLFADHTWAEVAVEHLLPGDRSRIHWDRTTFSPHDIAVPTEDGTVEISWLPIRALTDPAFAAHLDAVEKRSLARTGRQLRTWREEQHLSLDALANAAGVDAAILAQIEDGSDDRSYSKLGQILAVLGHTRKELALAAGRNVSETNEAKPQQAQLE